MKLPQVQRTYIKSAFNNMKSLEDLLDLLNYSKILLLGDKTAPLTIKQLKFHCSQVANPQRYIQFSIRKKSGLPRTIHAPNIGLKTILRCLNLIFQNIVDLNPNATGFKPGSSIVDNAKIHAGNYYVYNIDLKDFFPSIDQARIWSRLKHPPFNLNEETQRLDLANLIASLCCHPMEVERLDENNQWQKQIKSVLPQGAPTSPTLTNIICQKMDFRLTAAAKRFGLKYSRYADDITFSSLHNVFQVNSDFLHEIQKIITEQHFIINESKTRLQKQGHRQEVTGLLVNDKVNVQLRYIKQLRLWLHRWETFDFYKASAFFLKDYTNTNSKNGIPTPVNKRYDRWNVKETIFRDGKKITSKPNMINVISGKLEYLKMVKGSDSPMYKKLKARFDALNSKNIVTVDRKVHLDLVLELIGNEKFNEAMKIYQPLN